MLVASIYLFSASATLGVPGDLDASFGMSGVTITPIGTTIDQSSGTVLQPDGKIVVAGFCNTGSNYDFCVVRYQPDGSLDPSFGINGKVTTAASLNLDERTTGPALQPDGKIVVAGYNSNGIVVIRYNPNGSLDTSFDMDGIATTLVGDSTNFANDIVLQPDGKIVVAGNAFQAAQVQFAVVRFLSDGSLDMTFGTGGKVLTPIGSNSSQGYSTALQQDGRIIVGGYGFAAGSVTNFALVRYNSDGTLDMNFDGDGKVVTPVGNESSVVSSVAVQADGKIVAAGYASGAISFTFALARYNSDGSLDMSFDTDGQVVTQLGTESIITSTGQQPDGKLLVVGYSRALGPTYYDFDLARYNSNGSLDASFGTAGIVTTALSPEADVLSDFALRPDGKIVVCGSSYNGIDNDFAVARYTSNGTLDSSFGFIGRVSTPIRSVNDEARAVAIQPDGKIITAGSSRDSIGRLAFALVRYTADGRLDPTFFFRGKVTTQISNSEDVAYGVAVQSDGKILAAGSTGTFENTSIAVVRYNSDGTLDTTFDGDGILTLQIGTTIETARAIAVQPDGKIVIAGSADLPANPTPKIHFLVVRLNSNGSLDSTFDNDGIATTLISNTNSYVNALALQGDGKIVVAGQIFGGPPSQFALARFNSNGSLDSGFGTMGGTVVTPIGSGSAEARAVAVQPDGKLVAAGWNNNIGSGQDFALVRYNSDGSLDPTFDGDGKLSTAITGDSTDAANAVIVQPSGKIIAAGISVILSSSNFNFTLTRYTSNGSLDTTFGGDGIVTTDWGILGESANAAVLQSDGKLLVAGGSYNGPRREFTVLRYLVSQNSMYDFDGDGKTDVSVFRPSNGFWYILQSSNGAFRADQFGTNGDLIAPGDYDGDGKADTAVFRPSNGYWYFIDSSTGAFRATQFGQAGDVPATGDYDGDGKFDIAVFRPATGIFYFLRSTDGAFQFQQWGQTGDVPVMGDYDGDSKTDFAIFRPSIGTFYILRSSDGGVVGQQFGQSGDKPIAGDFDGDGKTDIAVFRPSTGGWYYLQSSENSFRGIAWGTSGDLPVAGDYDGDGKWDVAVFRPSSGTFYILQSTNNSLRAEQFGAGGDVPVPSAYVY